MDGFNLRDILPELQKEPVAKDGYTGPFKAEPADGRAIVSKDYYVSAGVRLVDIVFGDGDDDDTNNVYTFRAG